MRFSEAKGRKVVSTSSATTVGKVSGFAVDAQRQQVVAVGLKKTEGDADALLWPALTAFGRDAVTVPDVAALTVADGDVAELLGKARAVLGRRVLTERGDSLGEVEDVDFDPATGRVTALITGTEEVEGSRLIGAGTFAVVVRAAGPTS